MYRMKKPSKFCSGAQSIDFQEGVWNVTQDMSFPNDAHNTICHCSIQGCQ
jgi:hypothetical protein